MSPTAKQALLRQLPSIDKLLSSRQAAEWLAARPHDLVARAIRDAVGDIRRQIGQDEAGLCGPAHVTEQFVLARAAERLAELTSPHVRGAINATGVILHTGLGRAVLPETVVDSMTDELKGYVTLAIDRRTGQRLERDELVEYILTELTGAEAATVVNNNAAATLIVLAALAAGREVIVSRGQLIEIGGSFRLPDVMARSGARMVEVGTTNRTHLRDYQRAVTESTAAIMRVHPSNFRVVGFTAETPLADLVELAHSRGLIVVDDLGAGALIDLQSLPGRPLPHEPTAAESIAAGADVVLFSADKLIGGPQGGVIVGKAECIQRIRAHPLMRAVRVDKTCLMGLERTLHLFRDPQRLVEQHPLYRMLCTPGEVLERRAAGLAEAIKAAAPKADAGVVEAVGYLGSGSLPTEQLAGPAVAVTVNGMKAADLAERLRTNEACIFTRIEGQRVLMDVRTLTDNQVPLIAAAMRQIAG